MYFFKALLLGNFLDKPNKCKKSFFNVFPGRGRTRAVFFTPKPRSYTSLLLEGVARNYFSLFIYMDIASKDHAIYMFPTSYAQGEKENLSWNQTQVLFHHKQLL